MTTRARNGAYLRELRRTAKADGKCGTCRHRPAKPGRVTCVECLANGKECKRRLEAKRISAGLCRCGATPTDGLRVCAACRARHQVRELARRARRLAAGLCTRCGTSTAGKVGRYLCVGCTRVLANYAKAGGLRRRAA